MSKHCMHEILTPGALQFHFGEIYFERAVRTLKSPGARVLAP